MKLKRVLAVLLALCMILPLAACGDKEEAKPTDAPGKDTPSSVVTTTTEVGTPSSVPGLEPTPSEGETTVPEEGETTVPEEGETTIPEEGETTIPEEGETTVPEEDGTTKPNQSVTTKPSQSTSTKVTTTTTTTKGKTTTTTRTTKKKPSTVTQTKATGKQTLAQITIAEGTVKMDKGLNFGGKTFRHAKNGAGVDPSSDYMKWCAEFEKTYNCKLEIYGLSMSEYTSGITSAMASGDPYDIVFMYDEWFPSQIIANTMLPLDEHFTTADLWNDKSMTEGGLSRSLSEDLSLNGRVYVVGGTYLTTPGTIWYNKKIFADAGYDGSEDPLALYKAGKWTWDKYYEMLSDIQDVDSGLYGMNSISPYYSRMMFPSFGTDIAIKTKDSIKANLGDAKLYKAFETMQKFNYGAHRVTDPKNQYEDGAAQFLNGTTASWMNYTGGAWQIYKAMDEKTYTAFGSKEKQKSNVGMVPLPVANDKGIHAIWAWMGYGAGNGTDEDGIKAAIAFALNDSRLNHKNVYHPDMPKEIKDIALKMADSDKLSAPMIGFKSSAGSLGHTQTEMCRKIANQGQNVTVVLKGYEKIVQTIIETSLKA